MVDDCILIVMYVGIDGVWKFAKWTANKLVRNKPIY